MPLFVVQSRHFARDIHTVQREIDEAMSKLNSADPRSKRILLRRLRRLIAEADRLLGIENGEAA